MFNIKNSNIEDSWKFVMKAMHSLPTTLSFTGASRKRLLAHHAVPHKRNVRGCFFATVHKAACSESAFLKWPLADHAVPVLVPFSISMRAICAFKPYPLPVAKIQPLFDGSIIRGEKTQTSTGIVYRKTLID
jgi:hypothetical protein